MKTLALHTAVALLIMITALAVWQMSEAVILLIVAAAVASGLTPLVNKLTDRGMEQPKAAALVFGGGVILVVAALALLGLLLGVELAALADELPIRYVQAREALAANGGWLAGLANLLPSSSGINDLLLGGDAPITQTFAAVLSQAGTLVALGIAVASLGFYWLVEEQRFARLWFSLLPLAARTRTRGVWEEVSRELGIYVRGVATLVGVTTLGLLSVFTLAGVPGATLLALLGGLSQVVPLLGVPLAIIPGALVGFSLGPLPGALALAGALFVVGITRLVIGPILYRDGVNVNPVLVVVLIMALAELGGIGLALLGPPLAAVIQASTRIIVQTQIGQAARPRAERIDDLEERLERITAEIDPDNPDAQRIQGLVERARKLIGGARGA